LAPAPRIFITVQPVPAGAGTPFAKCLACHNAERGGADGLGPNLFGVFGRSAASRRSFAYSEAMRRSGIRWDAKTLDQFIADPRSTVPGTKMTFPGLHKPEDRQAVIAFLKGRS
jgi:cytochrome c